LSESLHGARRPYLLTNSEMSTWRRCKRKWWFSYRRGLATKKREINKPRTIGTRLHLALQAHYDPTDGRDALTAFEEALRADLEGIDQEERPFDYSDLVKEGDLCRAMIEGYVQWLEETGNDSDLEVLAAEDAARAKLSDDVEILSKIDVRVRQRSDGARLAMDHKSVGSLTQPIKLLQLDTQMLTEHLVEYLDSGMETRVDGVLYNMLRKVKRTASAKPPFYGREPVRHNLEELRNHWRHVKRIADEILAAHDALDAGVNHQDLCYPSPMNNRCEWDCDFFAVCALCDDGSDIEGALADHFEVVDPLRRYADERVQSLLEESTEEKT